jgi:hypothetical protein
MTKLEPAGKPTGATTKTSGVHKKLASFSKLDDNFPLQLISGFRLRDYVLAKVLHTVKDFNS